MTIRELVIKWGFDVDTKAIDDLEKSIKSIKTLAKSAAVAITGMGVAAGFLLKTAGEFEQVEVAFETMLGSAEKSTKVLNDLYQLARRTPFEIPDILAQSKLLLAYNIEADKLVDTITMLGDIAAGVGRHKFPFLALAFGQVRTATRLYSTEVRQLREAGVPILTELAKLFGVQEAEVQQMIERREVSFEDVEKAFRSMTNEGGRFFNLMEKQSKTLFGLLSIVKDVFTLLRKDLGDILLMPAKGMVSEFLSFLNENREKILRISEKSIKFILKSLKSILDFLGTYIAFFVKLTKAVGGLNNALKITLSILGTIVGLGIANILGRLTVGVLTLAKGFKILGNQALIAQLKMGAIGVLIAALIAAFALLAEDIIGFYSGKESVLGLFVGKLFEWLFKIKQVLSETVDFVFDKIKTKIEEIKNLLPDPVMRFVSAVTPGGVPGMFKQTAVAAANIQGKAAGTVRTITLSPVININAGEISDPVGISKAVLSGLDIFFRDEIRQEIFNIPDGGE